MRLRALDKGLAFTVTVRGRMPAQIVGDPTRLRQILVNLVGNAIKFTDAGAVEIVVSHDAKASAVRFEVADTGPGLGTEQLARMFMPFTQADSSTTRRFGGTGLGLTISRRLARLMGGDIDVDSAPGIGSSFTLRIAAHALGDATIDGDALALTPIAPPAIETPHRSARVLFAEDGFDNQRLVTTWLRRAGITVTVVDNGRDAVDAVVAAAERDDAFDVVLMDMQMPVLDGYGAATELRARGFALPIVALTAHAMAGDAERCRAAGCSDYLTKPIDRAALLRTVIGCAPACDDPLYSSYASDPDMNELIADFVAGLATRSQELGDAAAKGDLPTLRRIAHQLKGAAGGYGYAPITDAAATLERACDEGSENAVRLAALATLQRLCARALARSVAA